MKKQTVTGLGSLQSEVMEIVWERGEATVKQVMQCIAKRRDVSYTTVLVAMQKLAKKGWLKHRSVGRAYVYTPTRSRHETRGRLLRDLLKTAFNGDPQLLLTSLLEDARLSDAELADLWRLIEKRRKEPRNV